jgi:hypothetical protein
MVHLNATDEALFGSGAHPHIVAWLTTVIADNIFVFQIKD